MISTRSVLIAIILFLGLTIANLLFTRQHTEQTNPYGSAGSLLRSIATAAAAPGEQARQRTLFWWREAGALVVCASLFALFSGAGSRRG